MNPSGKSTFLRFVVLAAALCVAGFSPASRAADNEGWRWVIAPYAWLPSVSANLNTINPPNINVSNDTSFNNLLSKIDGAFEIHAEGSTEHFGAFTDYTYLGLSDSHTFRHFNTHSNLDNTLFELAGFWHPGDQRDQGVELFGGLRYIGANLSVNFDPYGTLFPPTELKSDHDYSDFMLGVRYTWALSQRWELTGRFDGSFGQTDGTWNTSLVAGYKMQHGAWLFGYRYLYIKLPARNTALDITLQGPMIGYGFMF